MSFTRYRFLGIAGVLLILCGCAAGGMSHSSLKRMIAQGEYAKAESALLLRTAREKENATTQRLLGMAQYHLEQYESADEHLANALALDPEDPVAHLYAGFIAERQDRTLEAIHHYLSFLSLRSSGDLAADVRRRVRELKVQYAEQLTERALAREQEISPGALPDSTLGVVYFDGRFLPDGLKPLVTGLADLLASDLKKVGALRIVERMQINTLLDELQISQTAAFDTTTAPRLGKLLGAAHILGGTIAELPREQLRIDPALVNTKTGEVETPEEAVEELDQIIKLEKDVVFATLDQLDIKLTKAERDSIAKPPTESFLAFLMYSRGLAWLDSGNYERAHEQFKQAVYTDPNFQQAAEKTRTTKALIERPAFGNVSEFEQQTTSDPLVRGRSGAIERSLVSGHERLGFVPESGRGVDEPYVGPYGHRSPTATVIIEGSFDDGP